MIETELDAFIGEIRKVVLREKTALMNILLLGSITNYEEYRFYLGQTTAFNRFDSIINESYDKMTRDITEEENDD